MLILKEENDRLRQNHISIQEVERLLEENRLMKFELQKLKGETNQGENPPEFATTLDANLKEKLQNLDRPISEYNHMIAMFFLKTLPLLAKL